MGSDNFTVPFDIPETWEPTTLGAICARSGGLLQTGPFGSQLHACDYVEVGIPSIMPINIGAGRIIEDGIKRITNSDATRLARHQVRNGDIVFSRRGDVERHALVREREEGWLCGTGCVLVRVGDSVLLPRFASYWLQHPDIRSWLVANAVGSTMPNLNTSIMAGVPIAVPSIREQHAIVRVLGVLDDKIELNRRMNRTLEELARAVFKSWFVDFDPVVAKAAGKKPVGMSAQTAALLPGRFQDSELGPIPKGWRAGSLGEIAQNPRRGVQPADLAPGEPYIALEHMPRRCIALDAWDTSDGIMSQKFRFRRGDILFGKLRPYFHKVGVAPVDGVCSTDILVVAPKAPEWLGVVLGHASSDEIIQYADGASTGTKMPRTNWGDLAQFKIGIPSVHVAAAFSKISEAIVSRIAANIFATRTLVLVRDALLPRLMSGELRVRQAEKIAAQTA